VGPACQLTWGSTRREMVSMIFTDCSQYELTVKMILTVGLYYKASLKSNTDHFYKTSSESVAGENAFFCSDNACEHKCKVKRMKISSPYLMTFIVIERF